MRPKRLNKRAILLLEVLIAFALVVLCVFPLIAPHVFMLKAQYQFNQKIALDQTVTRIYGRILEKVYRNEIPWQAFEQNQVFPIDAQMLQSVGAEPGFGYKGSYGFSISRHKGNKEKPFSANVINVSIAFDPLKTSSKATPEEKLRQHSVYEYKFFAARIQESQETKHEE